MTERLVLWARRQWGISERTAVPSPWHAATLALRVLVSRYYLRACTRVGRLPRVWGRPRIRNGGRLTIGRKPMIVSTIVPTELVVQPGAEMTIGDQVYINYGASFAAYESIRIGDRCIFGTYVIMSDNDQHDLYDHAKLPPSQPVVIEDDVWIGDRVMVLKGVRIGAHAVIGAGSVVTHDIPPYAIAAGVPARVLGSLQQPPPAAVQEVQDAQTQTTEEERREPVLARRE